jgi:NADPH:quinone reductase-like Zn-dependent oxidoreductase
MRAAVQHRYGSGSVLEVQHVPLPVPRSGEVLVRVRAAGLSRGAWHLMTGRPYLVRIGTGLRRPRRSVPGMELAGEVVALGQDVAGVEVGDHVFGFGHSTFAEYSVARAARLAPKPATLSFEQAAALPDAGTTALQALIDHGRIHAGQRVLVIGASGGVGVHAVQLAAALGAEVTGVCSGAKADLVRAAGAVRVVDYAADDLGDPADRYELVLDIGGNRPVRTLRSLLAPGGTLVFVGGEHGGRWFGGIGRQVRAVVRSVVQRHRVVMFVAKEQRTHLDAVAEQVAAGRLRPVVDRVVALDQAGQAMERLESGLARGKLVVVPGP